MTLADWVTQGHLLAALTALAALLAGASLAVLAGIMRRGDLKHYDARCTQLRTEAEARLGELQSLDSDLREAQATILEAQRIKADQAALENADREVRAAVNELEAKLDQKRRELDSVTSDLRDRETAARQADRAQDRLDALTRELGDLEKALGPKREEMARLRDQLTRCDAAVADARRDERDARREAERARDETEQLKAECGDVPVADLVALAKDRSRRDALVDEVQRLEARRDAAHADAAAATAREREAAAVLDGVTRQHDGLKNMLEQLVEQHDAAARRKEDAEQASVAAERRLREFEQGADEAEARALRAGTDAEEAEARAVRADEARQRAEERLRIAQEALKALEAASLTLGDARLSLDSESLKRLRKILAKLLGKQPPSAKDTLRELRQPPRSLRVIADKSAWSTGDQRPDVSERDALERLAGKLTEANISLPRRVQLAFHTSLKTAGMTPLTVLAGLSGTGKSQLPRAYAASLGLAFEHVPVEPGWDSPQDLLGFFDYLTKDYRATERARLLVHMDEYNWAAEAQNFKDRMALVLLDEMNLSRTEYYFSEFLSRLEMRPRERAGIKRRLDPAQRKDSEIQIQIPHLDGEDNGIGTQALYLGHRVLWVGTLNEDESTQTLSDKVLDRANTLRFPAPDPTTLQADRIGHMPEPSEHYLPFQVWQSWRTEPGSTGSSPIDPAAAETIVELARIMRTGGFGFGHRVAQAMTLYTLNYPQTEDEGTPWRDAIADQIEMRLLPKLAGKEATDGLRTALDALHDLSAQTLGDEALADEIKRANDEMDQTTVLTWPGVARTDT